MTLSAEIEVKQVVADLGYQATVRIGGSDPDKFLPNINCSFKRLLSDEYFLNINAADVLVSTEKETLSEVSEITVEDRTERYYVDNDGALEYQSIFESKPESNIISLQIKCSSDLYFAHQKRLTPAEIEYGFQRPENEINSYIVKATKKHNEYKDGNIGLIYRSWVEDVNGNREWCPQVIDVVDGAGTWQIEIPEHIWQDESLYPLTVGPRLGLETEPASFFGLTSAVPFAFYLGVMPEDGTLNFIRIFDRDTSSIAGLYVGLYDGTASAPGSPIFESTEITDLTGGSAKWHEITGGGESLPAGTHIWVLVHTDDSGDIAIAYNDDVGNPSEQYMSGVPYGTFPEPWVNSGGIGDREFAIYIDYDGDGGAILPINDNASLTTAMASILSSSEIGQASDLAQATLSVASILSGNEMGSTTDPADLTSAIVSILSASDTGIASEQVSLVNVTVTPIQGAETCSLTDVAALVTATAIPLIAIVDDSISDMASLTQATALILPAVERSEAVGSLLTPASTSILVSGETASALENALLVDGQGQAIGALEVTETIDIAELTSISATILTAIVNTGEEIGAIFGTPLIVPVFRGKPILINKLQGTPQIK